MVWVARTALGACMKDKEGRLEIRTETPRQVPAPNAGPDEIYYPIPSPIPPKEQVDADTGKEAGDAVAG